MSSKLLFVFDLDGIIIDDEKNIKPDIFERIIEVSKKGNIIAVFSRNSHIEFLDLLNILKKYVTYFVGLNGSIIINLKTDTKIRSQKTLDYSFIKLILNDVKELKGFCQIMTSNEVYTNYYQLYSNDFINSKMNSNSDENEQSNFNFLDIYKNPNLLVLQISIKLPEEKDKIFKEFIDNYYGSGYSCIFTENKFIDINTKGVSKYNSLLKIIKLEDINIRNVFVFVNSESSLKIVETFPNSFIVDNNLETKNISNIKNKLIPKDDNETICFEITSILQTNTKNI
ncbi:MAG: HAD hydrolase family protein [Metamycoplasmataceae bacterium]